MKHRPRVVIYIDILAELRERPSGPTRISRIANLSYDTCIEILGELESKALIRKSSQEGHDVYGVTKEGFEVVDEWSKVWEKLKP